MMEWHENSKHPNFGDTRMLWAFCFLICFVGGLMFLAGMIFHTKIVRRVGLTALILFGIPLIFAGAVSLQNWNHTRVPANNFKDVFDCSPPPDVTDLQSEVGGWGCAFTFLKFHVSPSTFARLSSIRWQQLKKFDSGTIPSTNVTPQWWNPPITPHTTIYVPIKKNGNFSSNDEFFLYDNSTQTAYFFYDGID